MKTCKARNGSGCGKEKPLDQFSKKKDMKDGYTNKCKECMSEMKKKIYYARHDYYKEQHAEYRASHREERRRNVKQHRLNNLEKYKEYNLRKEKGRQQASVAWADKIKIREIYIESRRISEETGVKHHVDHQIPLTHPLVCGLHVETNLEIITGLKNMKKHNSFTPGPHYTD